MWGHGAPALELSQVFTINDRNYLSDFIEDVTFMLNYQWSNLFDLGVENRLYFFTNRTNVHTVSIESESEFTSPV